MKREHLEFKIGMVAFVALALTCGFLLVIEQVNPFTDKYSLEIGFSDAQQLLVGAPVNMSGVKIGRVKKLKINPTPKPGAIVLVEVEIAAKYRIPQHSVFRISTTGLFGNNFLKVIPPMEGEHNYSKFISTKGALNLTGETPATLDEILEKGRGTMDKVDGILTHVNAIIGDPETKSNIKGLIKNMQQSAEKFNAFMDSLRTDMKDISKDVLAATRKLREILTQNQKDVESTVKNIRQITKQFNTITSNTGPKVERIVSRIDQFTAEFEGVEFKSSLKKIRNNFVQVSENMESLTQRASEIVGNPKLETKIHGAIDAASNAANALADIKEGLTNMKTEFETQILYNNDSENMQSNFYLDSVFRDKYLLRAGFENPEDDSGAAFMGGIVKNNFFMRAGLLNDKFGISLEKEFKNGLTLGLESYDLDSPVHRAFSKFKLNEHSSMLMKVEDFTDSDNSQFLVGVSHTF
jgi:virulence factor Mce-like protein